MLGPLAIPGTSEDKPGAMAVTLSPADVEDKPALKAMLSTYNAELSPYDDVVTPDYPYFDAYWEPGERRYPYLIHMGPELVGFALVRDLEDGDADHSVAEFYILPSARSRGAGVDAAKAVFKQHPGAWTLSMFVRNGPARAFWPKAIAAAGGVNVAYSEDERFVTYRFGVAI